MRELKKGFSILHGFLLLGFVCVCAARGAMTDAQYPMDLWQETDPRANQDTRQQWGRLPTWHKTYQWDLRSLRRHPSYRDVLAISNAYFNWVVQQIKDNRAPLSMSTRNKRSAVIVSTMYDPVSGTMESSTIPRGPRKTFMISRRNAAPRWYAATERHLYGGQGIRYADGVRDSRNELQFPYCAEDGMAFTYETRGGNGLAGQQTMKYNPQSFVAVWGSTNPMADDVGMEMHPCLVKSGTALSPGYAPVGLPGCTLTLNELGVIMRLPSEIETAPAYRFQYGKLTALLPRDWDEDWEATWFNSDTGLPWEPMNEVTEAAWRAGGGGLGWRQKRDEEEVSHPSVEESDPEPLPKNEKRDEEEVSRPSIEEREPAPLPKKGKKKPPKAAEKSTKTKHSKTEEKSTKTKHSKSGEHATTTAASGAAKGTADPTSVDMTAPTSDLGGLWADVSAVEKDGVSGGLTLTAEVSMLTGASVTRPTPVSTAKGPLSFLTAGTAGAPVGSAAKAGSTLSTVHGKPEKSSHHAKATKSK